MEVVVVTMVMEIMEVDTRKENTVTVMEEVVVMEEEVVVVAVVEDEAKIMEINNTEIMVDMEETTNTGLVNMEDMAKVEQMVQIIMELYMIMK